MVLDTDGKQTPDSVDRAALLQRAVGRPIDVEWKGISIWTRQERRRRALRQGPRVSRRRRGAPAVADRRARHEYRHRRCGRSRLEACGGAAGLGRRQSARRPTTASGGRSACATCAWRPSFIWRTARSPAIWRRSRTSPKRAKHCAQRLGEGLTKNVGRMFRTAGLQLGYRYEASPICIADGRAAARRSGTYLPSAHPGSRAPHAWLARRPLDRSICSAAVLCCCNLATRRPPRLKKPRKARGVPLTVADLDEPDAAALYGRRLVLVRPDGHVAWRGDALPADVGCAASIGSAALLERAPSAPPRSLPESPHHCPAP